MTREQFDRAAKLREEIQMYSVLLGKIKCGISDKETEDEKAKKLLKQESYNHHNGKWVLSRFFRLIFKGNKVVAVPHYEFAHGIEMDADAELINIIIDYLERKKNECEDEFEQIGGNGA